MSYWDRVPEWSREYLNDYSEIVPTCPKCKVESPPLVTEFSFEQHHPRNKHVTKQDYERGIGHITEFWRCGFCNHLLYADGKWVGR